MLDADFGRALGTEKLAIHWVKLSPGKRSSTPHAESLEEEFVYVVSGSPHVWINGYIYQLESGMAVGFPAGRELFTRLSITLKMMCRWLFLGIELKKTTNTSIQ